MTMEEQLDASTHPEERARFAASQDRLNRLTDISVQTQWLSQVDERLKHSPDDPALKLYRANLLRAAGRLEDAQAAYAALPDNPMAARAAAILSGAPVDWADSAGPAPFVTVENFLDRAHMDRLWAMITAPSVEYVDTVVSGVDGKRPDSLLREALALRGSRAVGDWFYPLLDQVAQAPEILARLGVPAFTIGRRELQVTVHVDGGHLWKHRDTGPLHPDRHISFVLYFHHVPKAFSGGDLLLFDEQDSSPISFTRITPAHNKLILFPPDRQHAVARVTGDPDPLNGRWTVNGWLNRIET